MRIGISCYPTFGGSGVVASELGMALAERGHEVHFITYRRPERLNLKQQRIFFHQVTVPDYPLFEYAPYSLALASRLAECVDGCKLDLIHAHYAIPHAASALLARSMASRRVKVVTTLHGTDITLVGRDPSFLPLTRYAVEQSDAVTAVSHFLRDEACSVFACAHQIQVIYNFIDIERYEKVTGAALRRKLAPNGERLLIHVSNFRPVKRVGDVYEVFRRIQERTAVKLLLVGQGPDLAGVLRRARADGQYDDVIHFHPRAFVEEIIAASDVLLLPSETESFGLAALEAMACGTPVVAADAGGLPELIEPGRSGYLCEVGDVEAMTGAVWNLLSDAELHQTIAEAGRRRAFERFGRGAAVDRYEKVYWEVMGKKTADLTGSAD